VWQEARFSFLVVTPATPLELKESQVLTCPNFTDRDKIPEQLSSVNHDDWQYLHSMHTDRMPTKRMDRNYAYISIRAHHYKFYLQDDWQNAYY